MRAACLIAMVGALGLAHGASAKTAGDQDPRFFSSGPDQAVVKAEADAKRTLPIFWSKYAAKSPGVSDYSVKVVLPTTDGRGEEVIWMTVDERRTPEVIGRLQNQPFRLGKLHLGSTISADESLIRDWSYVKAGKRYGSYSIRALMPRATSTQRADALKLLAPTPLESGAR